MFMFEKFNDDERALIEWLVKHGKAATLREITQACWPRKHGTDDTSRTRNNLRRPVREGWVINAPRPDDHKKMASPIAVDHLAAKAEAPLIETLRAVPAADDYDLDDATTKEKVAVELLEKHDWSDSRAHKADPRFSRGYLIGVKKRHGHGKRKAG
jgi:hypothetical protein